ncbi:MmgE/PrpD family protein, partial [Mesorhizobium sp. M1A.F.Ca.IN.022.04.1.1]
MDQRTAEGESASTVFARVADFVLRRSAGAFPRDVLKSAALQFLDTMGIAIAAGPMQAGQIARDAAVMLYGSGADRHAARMIFDGRRASMAGAAFAAATQTDNLDGHDGYPPTKGHIGVAVIPALLAL